MKFSIIIPVFNRPEETAELLESLSHLEYKNFEVIVVEDGSSVTSESIVNNYSTHFDLKYFYKSNTGPGDSRNFGASQATGDYLVFFDSDCIIPHNYLNIVNQQLSLKKLDVFGGPDKTPDGLTNTQKAINYAMTSFLTTGGIRGHRLTARSFQPRSFNMGITQEAFTETGGFSNIHPGEDPDLVYRMLNLGYTAGLLAEAFVYHKRRVNFSRFAHQVYKFGLARTILMKWHPASKKLIFAAPSVLTVLCICLLGLGLVNMACWFVLLGGLLIVFLDSLVSTGSLATAVLAIPATAIQFSCYGWGFLTGWWNLFVLGRNEQNRFPEMFMGSKPEN